MHSNYVVNRPSDPLVVDSHFAIFELNTEKHWWKGTPIDPYPYLVASAAK